MRTIAAARRQPHPVLLMVKLVFLLEGLSCEFVV
jgi:hypothetical protein